MLPVPVIQGGLLYDRWRHHRSPPPQFRHGTGGEGNILQPPALVVSAATAHKTFGPTDIRARTPCILGGYLVASGIEPRPSGLEYDALTTRLPTVLLIKVYELTHHLEESKIGIADVVEVDVPVDPRIIKGQTLPHIWCYLDW
ncbi:uncharacterized protein TNCV_4381771 [Trichonephila clavipes]|nr:uncharacterized protein TNCV_4381771 [Trichonephila clavipes]